MISIIIVNFNSGDRLVGAVFSVLASNMDVEVIVSDNHSHDQSMLWLRECVNGDERVREILNDSNLGFSSANNVALALASREYLLFLNPDCVVHTQTLSRLAEVLDGDASIGMAGCLIRNPDGTEQKAGRRRIPTPFHSLIEFLGLSNDWRDRLNLHGLNEGSRELPAGIVEVEAISGACMFVRRDALRHVGPLDEGYFLHCEDLDWCMRFRKAGWKIVFVPDVEVTHFKGTCSKSRPIFVEWHKHKGMMRFYRKFFRNQYPGVLMWLVALGVWSRFAVLATYYGMRHLVRRLGLARG